MPAVLSESWVKSIALCLLGGRGLIDTCSLVLTSKVREACWGGGGWQPHRSHKFSLSLQYPRLLNGAGMATEGQKPALNIPFSCLKSEP